MSQILGTDGELKPLDQATCAAVKQLKDQWSTDGKQVILLARKVLSTDSILPHPLSVEFEAQMPGEAKTGLIFWLAWWA
jgi:hypothetical protein